MSVPNATESADIVAVIVAFPLPSKDAEPVTSPANASVLEVSNAVAVEALPSKSAINVPFVQPLAPVFTTVVGSVAVP